MVHHISLYKFSEEPTPEMLEELMRTTRIQLLKIPEVLNVRCGKRILPENEWQFFVALDFENTERRDFCFDGPIYTNYIDKIIRPVVSAKMSMDFEMEPYKDVKYS
jgi:hypothetical protein